MGCGGAVSPSRIVKRKYYTGKQITLSSLRWSCSAHTDAALTDAVSAASVWCVC